MVPFLYLCSALAPRLAGARVAARARVSHPMKLLHALARWLAPLGLAASLAAAPVGPPPGVVIDTTPLPETEYIGSPSIAILPDGGYVASHDFFGKKGDELRAGRIFGSHDRGATWQQLAQLPDSTWGTLFVHHGALYWIAITQEYGDVVLRRSTDGGHTWTTPSDAAHGLLFKGRFHSAPVPVVVHHGRVWRAVEEVVNDQLWPRHFAALMISAPEDADLLDAANWSRTNGVTFDPAWLPGRRPGWLEGNAVITPAGSLANLLRVNTEVSPAGDAPPHPGATGIPRYEIAARLDLAADGRTLAFDPAQGFFRLPGSQSKFTIRYDPVSQRYWSLVNKVTRPHAERDANVDVQAQRNVVRLISSADLRTWEERSTVLRWREGEKLTRKDRFAFQYLDWQFDGDDLIAVARTAWEAQSFHNANYLTFHRVKNFRTRTPADSAPDLAGPATAAEVPAP